MPRNAPKPGSVTKLCICGSRIGLSSAACRPCWDKVPAHVKTAWLVAKDGDCDSGPALARAAEAIRVT